MFNVGGGEMLAILLLALIVLGPERLPKAMGEVGRWVAQLRRMSNGFQDEIRRAMDPENAPFRPGEERLAGPVPAIEDEVKVVNAGEAGDEADDAAAPEVEADPGPAEAGAAVEPEVADGGADAPAGDDAGDGAGDDGTVTPLRPRRDGDARAAG